MKKVKFYVILWISKIIALAINIIDKKRGTNKSGHIACKLCNNFISYFTDIDYNNVIFVTGTNGKSTTVNIIAHTLKTANKSIATNIEGANLLTGVATTLIKNSTLTGKFNKDILLLEIDERSLEKIYNVLPAKHLCITNLQKDQVQRNGEPDYIYQKIKKVINNNMTIYLNNEEPRIKSYEDLCDNVVFYGVEKNDKSFEKNDFYDVTCPCPKCNEKINFSYYNVDNIGKFECTNCNFKSNEDTKYFITDIDYKENTFVCNEITYKMTYNEPFFIYNFALAIALCEKFDVKKEEIKTSFETFKNIDGRVEIIKYKNKEIKYIRIKQENPETLQSAINSILIDEKPKTLMLGLQPIKDFIPYYTNTFYMFDCNLESIINCNVERYICFSEAVAYDIANRLIYAGVDKEKISVIPNDNDEDLLQELDKYDIDNVYLITWLKKYNELNKAALKYNEEV